MGFVGPRASMVRNVNCKVIRIRGLLRACSISSNSTVQRNDEFPYRPV